MLELIGFFITAIIAFYIAIFVIWAGMALIAGVIYAIWGVLVGIAYVVASPVIAAVWIYTAIRERCAD